LPFAGVPRTSDSAKCVICVKVAFGGIGG
jgi:hypothetical protein